MTTDERDRLERLAQRLSDADSASGAAVQAMRDVVQAAELHHKLYTEVLQHFFSDALKGFSDASRYRVPVAESKQTIPTEYDQWLRSLQFNDPVVIVAEKRRWAKVTTVYERTGSNLYVIGFSVPFDVATGHAVGKFNPYYLAQITPALHRLAINTECVQRLADTDWTSLSDVLIREITRLMNAERGEVSDEV